MPDSNLSQSLSSGPPSSMIAPGTRPAKAFSAASGGSEIGFSPDFHDFRNDDPVDRRFADHQHLGEIRRQPGRRATVRRFHWFFRVVTIGGTHVWRRLWFNAGLKP
ncbi:hypothetical protein [Mesorhizobium sp.]